MPKFACCLCEKNHLHPDLLINHLKIDHSGPSIYIFICNEENCKQKFHNIHRFKKHLGKHVKDIVPYQHSANQIIENVSFLQESSSSLEMTTHSLQEFLPVFKQSLVSFLLDLHSNTTFPRNHIQTIKNSVTQRITVPISHMIRQVNDIQNKTLSEELLRVTSNPFLDIDTEYKFFKELEKLQLYKPPIKYTIANDLSGIVLNHNPTLSEDTIEITLLDIPFQIQKILESEGVLKKTYFKYGTCFNFQFI